MHFPHPISVKIRRPGGTDRFGNPLAGTTHILTDCAWSPINSVEVTGPLRDTVKTGIWLFGQADDDIAPQDEVWGPDDDWDAEPEWFVDGDIDRYRHHPFTSDPEASGFKCDLTRIKG